MNNPHLIGHKPVLIHEVIHALNPKPHKTYIDATFGCGGHTRAILEKEPLCNVIALDYDKETLDLYGPHLKEKFGDRLTLLWGNFAHLYKLIKKEKTKTVDGILADFGTSQHQIYSKEGFSFYHDTPLDMRASKAHYYHTAEHVVNRFTERQLADIFFMYGEEKHAKKIARAIVHERDKKPIQTTHDLAALIERVIPRKPDRTTTIHPATKVFQALRIFINKELENITHFLPAATNLLGEGGILACISFHSLEDRLVKNFFLENATLFESYSKKPITASEEELSSNPSARSAKLRVAKKAY